MEGTTVLRRFNRTYTQRIGALDESFLGLGLPLASARLLFEVGSSGPVTVRQLRARLGLDSGYVSRLLRGLEQRHLVAVTPDPDDRRRRVVSLTRAGDRKLATGQARGLQRMVEDEKYCIDILTQVSAMTKALQAVSIGLLEEHMHHCVLDAAREGDAEGHAKVTEAVEAIARLVRS